MKHFLPILFIFSFNLVSPLLAQDKNCADMSALLENKIWKVQLPKDKQYAMEMEFRSAGWRTTFLYDLHFRSRITLRMDIGYFFQLQRTFKGGGVVVPTTEIKEVAGIGVYLRQVLDFVSKSQHIFYI